MSQENIMVKKRMINLHAIAKNVQGCWQGRIKLFGAPRQWKHFRPLFQAVFLSGGGI